jgi:hypothetical protein
VTAVFGAAAFVVALLAQVAPVLAQAADGGQGIVGVSPGAAFEAFRDVLNVGVIGVVGWAIRWFVVNLGPKLVEAADRHNRLVEKLEGAVDRIEEKHDSVQRKITELHTSCVNWKPKP